MCVMLMGEALPWANGFRSGTFRHCSARKERTRRQRQHTPNRSLQGTNLRSSARRRRRRRERDERAGMIPPGTPYARAYACARAFTQLELRVVRGFRMDLLLGKQDGDVTSATR